jgi:hypothetical protein
LPGLYHQAEVAKLVYALDLGSSAARRESSSLSFRTIFTAGFTAGPGPVDLVNKRVALVLDSYQIVRKYHAGLY